MVVISAAGIHWLTDEELEQLRTIYEEFQTTTTAALTKRLAKFKLGEATDDHPRGNGKETRDGDDE
jgi:hypothetical protein